MNVFIYARKSKFKRESESIEVQIEKCKRYFDVMRDTISEDSRRSDTEDNIIEFADEGWSGKDLDRPQFKQMQKKIENGECDCLIIYRLDRLSRSVADFADLLKLFEEKKVLFMSVSDRLDTTSSQGKLMINITSAFAQFEREVIAERVRDNMHALAKNGRWLGGTTPLGFNAEKTQNTLHMDDGRDRTEYKLIPEETELQTVKLIFKKFLELQSLVQLDRYMLNHNILSRKEKNFSDTTLKSILQNPIYCTADDTSYKYFQNMESDLCVTDEQLNHGKGLIAFNRTQSNKKRTKNPISEWIIAVGKHDGIISGEDWVQVQEILDRNSSDKAFRKSSHPIALLSGVIKCSCGNFMRPKYNRPKKDKDEKQTFVYMCELKERSHRELCNSQNLSGAVDEMICNMLLEYDVKDTIVNKQLTVLQNKLTTADNTHKEEIKRLEETIEANERGAQNQLNFISDKGDEISEATSRQVYEKIETHNKIIADCQAELKRLKQADKLRQEADTKYITISDILKDFKTNFDTLSTAEKREFIKKVVSEITWDGENISVFLDGVH